MRQNYKKRKLGFYETNLSTQHKKKKKKAMALEKEA